EARCRSPRAAARAAAGRRRGVLRAVGREPPAGVGTPATALSRQGPHPPGERPLRLRDVCRLRGVFPRVEMEGFQLLSMVGRVLPRSRLLDALRRCDAWLLPRAPALQRWCRYVVLTVVLTCTGACRGKRS